MTCAWFNHVFWGGGVILIYTITRKISCLVMFCYVRFYIWFDWIFFCFFLKPHDKDLLSDRLYLSAHDFTLLSLGMLPSSTQVEICLQIIDHFLYKHHCVEIENSIGFKLMWLTVKRGTNHNAVCMFFLIQQDVFNEWKNMLRACTSTWLCELCILIIAFNYRTNTCFLCTFPF